MAKKRSWLDSLEIFDYDSNFYYSAFGLKKFPAFWRS